MAVFVCAPHAAALTLGEVAAVSAVGEPLRIEILAPQASVDMAGDCLRVVSPDERGDGIPAVRSGRVAIQGRGSGARIVVTQAAPMVEPVLRLAIDNVCGARLRREYTLLLEVPTQTRIAAAPARPTTPPRTQAAPSPRPPAPPTGGQVWTTAPGESPASLAQALYPRDAGARRAFIDGIVRANPGRIADPAAVLPAGTELSIPDLGRVAAASTGRTAAAAQRAGAAARTAEPRPAADPRASERTQASAAPVRAPATLRPADQLVLEGERHGAERIGGEGRPDLSGTETAQQAREELVVSAIDRTIRMQIELLERIRRLEEIQLALRDQVTDVPVAPAPQAAPSGQAGMTPAPDQAPSARLDTPQPRAETAAQAPGTSPAPAAPPAASTTPAPEPTGTSRSSHIALPDWGMWPLMIGLLLAATTGVYLARRRTPAERNETTSGGSAGATPAATKWAEEPDDARSTPLAPGQPRTSADALRPYDSLEWNRVAHPLEPEHDETLAPIIESSEDIEEHESAVELAEIMMSFGRVHGAAETLADFIRANPRRAITPWIKLLEAYRRAGMRPEFDALSRQLNKTFNVKTFTWDTFDEARKPSNSLEQLPHIVKQLGELWGTRECQAYLEVLVRDNRDGKREGFPIAIIDEILMLAAVLEDQLGRYRPTQPDPVEQAPKG